MTHERRTWWRCHNLLLVHLNAGSDLKLFCVFGVRKVCSEMALFYLIRGLLHALESKYYKKLNREQARE